MSFSALQATRDRFQFVDYLESDGQPLSQIPADVASKRHIQSSSDVMQMIVVCDGSIKTPCNLALNTSQDPFRTPEDEVDSSSSMEGKVFKVNATPHQPILYHSSGLWARSKKFRSKIDMRDLYFQHFLNLKRVSDYQLEVLNSTLNRAKRGSNVEDSVAISIFLHESSGLRTAIDADVELFKRWKTGDFKGGFFKLLSSEKMLFNGFIELLGDHWKHLTSQELFELPILRMLSRTPKEILDEGFSGRVKGINQRSYLQTLMHAVDGKDRGHTLY